MYPIATRTTIRIHLVQLAVFAFLLVPTLTAQTLPMDTIWTRYIGEGGSESRPSVARIPEGGYWVSCESIMLGASGNVLLTRLEEDGDTLFSRRVVGYHDYRGMIGCTDGGAGLFGRTTNWNVDSSYYHTQWIERISPTGESLWNLSIGDTLDTEAMSLIEASDNGFVAVGEYTPNGSRHRGGALVTKVNAQGILLWSVTFPNVDGDSIWYFKIPMDVVEAQDHSLVVTGRYYGYDAPNPDLACAFWMRLTAQGELIEFALLPEEFSYSLPIVILPNGNIAMACRCTGELFCIAELSIHRETVWTSQISLGGGSGWALDLDIGPNDTRVLTVQLDGHLYFIGLSEDGDSLYTVSSYASGIGSSQITHVAADTFVVTHSIQGLIPPYSDILVSKFLLPGSVSGVSNELRNKGAVGTFSLSTYPNPFNSTLAISLDVPLHQEITVSLYDLLGREVDVIHRGRLNSSAISYTTPASLASGIYFLRAASNELTAMQKVVLLK